MANRIVYIDVTWSRFGFFLFGFLIFLKIAVTPTHAKLVVRQKHALFFFFSLPLSLSFCRSKIKNLAYIVYIFCIPRVCMLLPEILITCKCVHPLIFAFASKFSRPLSSATNLKWKRHTRDPATIKFLGEFIQQSLPANSDLPTNFKSIISSWKLWFLCYLHLIFRTYIDSWYLKAKV